MKKIKLALLVLGASLFAGCSGDAVENTGEGNTAAKLTVIVRDAITGELVDGAEVSLLPSGPVVAKGGKVSFDGVRIGTQSLKVEKTGYAPMSAVTSNNTLNQISVNQTEGEYIFTTNERSVTVQLYPETANVYGYIFYTSTKGQLLPAKDVTVYAELTGTAFIKRLFEFKTQADGKYSFEGLPAGTSARIWAVAPEGGLDGIAFENITVNSTLSLVAGNYYAGRSDFSQTHNSAVFEPSFNSTVAKDGDIVFTFTEAIDPSSIKVGSSPTVAVNPVATLKWESNKLTISPLQGTEWKNDITVTFYSTAAVILKSTSGKTYSKIITITLELEDLSKAAVDGIAVVSPENFNYNATTANLRWNVVEGATSYAIYRKNDKDSSYMFVEEFNAIEGATIGGRDNVSLGQVDGDNSLNGRTVSFIVQAKNNTSISPLDTTKAVKVIDMVKPTFSSSLPGCLYFSEPINRNTLATSPILPTDQVHIAGGYICLSPTVTAETEYTISGIQDQYGNKYGTDGTAKITITP